VSSGQWQVPVLKFDADLLLGVLSEPDTERAVWGSSLTHVSELGRSAADLVARGRLLPGVIVDTPRAVWRPVLTVSDGAWARTLAASAPPALFAAGSDTGLDLWPRAWTALSTRRRAPHSASPDLCWVVQVIRSPAPG